MQANKWKKDDLRFDSYIQQLKKHGLQVHPAIKPAIFTLNNGLLYPGLRVQGKVIGPETLVTVPTSLLLTSHKAHQQPALSQVFTHSFYNTGQLQQDRILITYLLYVFSQKDQTNVWYHMVRVFSKELDILSFWDEQQVDRFADKSVRRASLLQRQNFQKQWSEFQNVKQEHEQFFGNYPQEAFSKQNYQWIYTHAVSRCFGSFMNSTYFTPFCQFFNHHCVDVSYQCVTQEEHLQQIKKNKEKKESIEENKQEQKQSVDNADDKSQTSSINSVNSVDYIQDGDFNYWQIQSYKIKWGGKVSFDLKPKQTSIIEKMYQQSLDLLQKHIIWSGYNFGFIGQVIEKLNIVRNEYLAGRKKFFPANEAFQHTKTIIESYKSHVLSYYRTMGHKYSPKSSKQSTIDNLPSSNTSNQTQPSMYQKTSHPPTKPYSLFLMQADSQALFYDQQQIYFCYGHISNRTMLIRYGCCIQDNAYEHVWFRLPLNKMLSPYPDLFEKLQEKGLPIYYKLKVKRIVWLFEVYLWLKMQRWEMARHSVLEIFYPHDLQQEIQIFDTMTQMLKQKVPQFTAYPHYYNLTDPSISYHEYFTRVYHKEKVEILQKQLKMIEFVKERLNEMRQAKKIIKVREFKENRFGKELKGYWKILQKGLVGF